MFSHGWLPTVQEVLQADWQDVWHSPQPPVYAVFLRAALFTVTICFAMDSSLLVFSGNDRFIYSTVFAFQMQEANLKRRRNANTATKQGAPASWSHLED